MDFSLLKKDHPVDIYVPSLQTYYQVKLTKVENDLLVIKKIKRIHERLPLNIGKIYLIYFGLDENVYCGKTKLIKIIEEPGEDISYILEKPEQLTSHERRRGSRVSYKDKVYYRLDDSPERDFNKEAQGIDLSRGGMCLTVSEYYKPKTILVIKLRIEDIELCVRAQIKWIKEEGPDKYLMGISFQELFLPV